MILTVLSLYYSQLNDFFAFSSEIKALSQIDNPCLQLDIEALDRYLTFMGVWKANSAKISLSWAREVLVFVKGGLICLVGLRGHPFVHRVSLLRRRQSEVSSSICARLSTASFYLMCLLVHFFWWVDSSALWYRS